MSSFEWNLLQIMLFCLSRWNTPYSASDWPHWLTDWSLTIKLICSRCKREKGCKGQKQSQRAESSRETSYRCPREILHFNLWLYLLFSLFIAFFELVVGLQLKIYSTFYIFSFAAVVEPTFDVSLNKKFCTLLRLIWPYFSGDSFHVVLFYFYISIYTVKVACPSADKYSCWYPTTFCLLLCFGAHVEGKKPQLDSTPSGVLHIFCHLCIQGRHYFTDLYYFTFIITILLWAVELGFWEQLI